MTTPRLAWIITLLWIASPAAFSQTSVVSVCQLLGARSGERAEVTVHGEIDGSHHNGYLLSEGINADPCPGWPRRFLTAPSVIGLEFTSAFGLQLAPEQERLNQDFLRRLIQLEKDRRLRNLKVTITGVFVRFPWAWSFRRGDGSYFSSGIDQNGVLGTLVMKSINQEGN